MSGELGSDTSSSSVAPAQNAPQLATSQSGGGASKDSPPRCVTSSMDIRPFVASWVAGGTFEHEGDVFVVPFLPSDLGDTALEDSEEVLVVELADSRGNPGWALQPRKGGGGPSKAVLRTLDGRLIATRVADVVALVSKRVDVLAPKEKRLNRSLYVPCSPLKSLPHFMVTLVKTEHLSWVPLDA